MSTVLDLNRRLATTLGWSNIVDVGNALLGSPPWAIPHARGQCAVPNWAGCWKDCGPLMVAYQIYPFADRFNPRAILAGCLETEYSIARISEHANEDAATRAAIVSAVIAKLEAAK
ncbi:MAG TPA: hypothetical protein VGD52_08895 [Pseudoduganella sp.]